MRRDPFAAHSRPAPTSALEYFTDREGFLEAFARHRETPEGQDLAVLVFYGVGGIGKTTLVRKLCADLARSHAPLPHARFNLENVGDQAQACRDVLIRLRSDLEMEFHVKFPSFDLALAVLIAQEGGERPSLVKVSDGLGQAFSAALELTPDILKAGLKIAGGRLQSAIQRSEPLERWVRRVGGTEALLELNERFAQDDGVIIEELVRRFAQDLAVLPPPPGNACRAALFLDTYEALWTGREGSLGAQAQLLDAWVRLLAEYLLGAGVLLVLAGRDRINWGDQDPEWETSLDQHLLGGVSAPDAQTFLARRGIGGPPPAAPDPLQTAILHCAHTADRPNQQAGCHLLALALSADIVDNTRQSGAEPAPALFLGVPPTKMAGELATRFLKSLHNRNLELWVEALSLMPRFDESVALALDAQRQSHAGLAGWEQLRRYSFVTAHPDGFFRMHRTMREVLRVRSSPDVTRALHAWFAHYWQERGEEGLAFYHRWCLDPEGQRQAWADEHEAALGALQMTEARTLLSRWAEVALDDDDRTLLTPQAWARAHAALGKAQRTTPVTPRSARLIGAIQHYHSALGVWDEVETPDEWAEAQAGLGAIYQKLPTADRAESLRNATSCFRAAGRVWTEEAEPFKWAELQNNLGITCAYQPTGDRATNLREGSRHFEAALRVWNLEDWPQKWANTQNNLGCNLLLMPGGDRARNLRDALAHFERIGEVQTEEAKPEAWAMTQHNLGIVYFDLPEGDRSANLHSAIVYFEAALRVHTEEALPDTWAETQNSLGNCFIGLEGLDALERALGHFEAAQRVWTEADNPDRWAQAQTGRGQIYAKMTEGERLTHLQEAVSCLRGSLRIHTEADFPEHFAKAQQSLGLALREIAAETDDAALRGEADACLAASVRGYRAVGLESAAEEAEKLLSLSA